MLILYLNGDNHIQHFHLGRYIVGYTFGNRVLRLRLRVAIKLNFRPYVRRYTSPNENFEYSYTLLCRCLTHRQINENPCSNQDIVVLFDHGFKFKNTWNKPWVICMKLYEKLCRPDLSFRWCFCSRKGCLHIWRCDDIMTFESWSKFSLIHWFNKNCPGSWRFTDKPGQWLALAEFDRSKAVLLLWIFYVFVLSCVCYVLCASVYMCFVVTCWERADLLALVCGVFCEFVTFPLVSWVRCGTWLYRFLIFATLLTLFPESRKTLYKLAYLWQCVTPKRTSL